MITQSTHPHIRISSVLMGLSSAMDLVRPELVNHHKQTTFMAGQIASELRISDQNKSDLGIAAILHDLGAISLNENFELSFAAKGMQHHANIGYLILREFDPFVAAADIVHFHHQPWENGRGIEHEGEPVPLESHLLHLADRVSILLDVNGCVLTQAKNIRETIKTEKGRLFSPEVVEAFLEASEKEVFWLGAKFSSSPHMGIESGSILWNLDLDSTLLLELSELFRLIIDFRSKTTAAHSRCVAGIAKELARMVGFSTKGCQAIYVAGNLHDLGKLAIPVQILEKPGPLNDEEKTRMKSHAYHTFRVLSSIGNMGDIPAWAAYHHETMDGKGYPFRIDKENLSLGSKIIAIADVFSALGEDRAYRSAFKSEDIMKIIKAKVDDHELDGNLVRLLEQEFDKFLDINTVERKKSYAKYEGIHANPLFQATSY